MDKEQAVSQLRSSAAWEELANSLTHGLGLLLSLAGVPILISIASLHGDGWRITGCVVYGITLLGMYSISTLYHGVAEGDAKKALRIADHICIYIFIAGTYTPFTLVPLRGSWGWSILATIWACALVGMSCRIAVKNRRSELISITAYLIMGWLCVVAVKPLLESVPIGGLVWLGVGGILYTGGIVFYLRDHNPYYHAIWHVFVLGGSICHYMAVLFYVVPARIA